jgi:hypothetical protein
MIINFPASRRITRRIDRVLGRDRLPQPYRIQTRPTWWQRFVRLIKGLL